MGNFMLDVVRLIVYLATVAGLTRLLVVTLSIGLLYTLAIYKIRLVIIVAPIAIAAALGAVWTIELGPWMYYTLFTILLAPPLASIYWRWNHSTIR